MKKYLAIMFYGHYICAYEIEAESEKDAYNRAPLGKEILNIVVEKFYGNGGYAVQIKDDSLESKMEYLIEAIEMGYPSNREQNLAAFGLPFVTPEIESTYKGEQKMRLNEVKGDLFNAQQGCYLAHCISGDYALGAGIAKKFVEEYDMRFKLHKNYPIEPGKKFGHVGEALLIDNVFNLVTKERCYNKPTYDCLNATLEEMRLLCIEHDIKKLAMPKIGCGLDKLEWDIVVDLIEDVFYDLDIDITIYSL